MPPTSQQARRPTSEVVKPLPVMVSHRFLDNQGDVNLFSQNGVPLDELKNFNGSAYKTLQNELADWVEAGAEVRYSVRLDDFRPTGRPRRVAVEFMTKRAAKFTGTTKFLRMNQGKHLVV